jgi:fatty acid CoA ligase FadD32
LFLDAPMPPAGFVPLPPEIPIAAAAAHWAANRPSAPAYTYVDYAADPAGKPVTLTWSDVNREVERAAAMLGAHLRPGERLAVMAPPSLEYLVVILAAFRAGAIAVPLFPPDLPGHADRLTQVLAGAQPRCTVTTPAAHDGAEAYLAGHQGIELLTITVRGAGSNGATREPAPAAATQQSTGTPPAPACGPNDPAYLQYTSGSTRAPAGVIITHGSLKCNAEQILRAGNPDDISQATALSWLPLFHDMGLVLTLALPLVAGAHAVFTDPVAFLMKPVRWLEMASSYQNVFTSGPNFAYEYCASRVTEAQKATLDLRSVRMFMVGAEPIRAGTLQAFSSAFAPCGLAPETMTPAYGLAEATVYVTSTPRQDRPRVRQFTTAALSRGRAEQARDGEPTTTLVGCGRPIGQQVAIVDTASCALVAPGEVGEIWVRGPNVAAGYFHANAPANGHARAEPPAQAKTNGDANGSRSPAAAQFGATLTGDTHGLQSEGWLRTGDLGLIDGDDLFVTGRAKDMIIVDGRNHYPQDIELTAEEAHEAVRPGRVVAFAVAGDGPEQPVVVAERSRRFADADPAEIARKVKAAISAHHGLRLHDFLLVEPGMISRTSSGKLARSASRARYLDGTLTQAAAPAPPAEVPVKAE